MGMKIKVCGIAEAVNAARVANLAPDYMGFIFHPSSPRNCFGLSPEVVRGLPEEITRVGVFVNRSEDEITCRCAEYGIATLQLHGNESPRLCHSLQTKGFTVWKAIGIDGSLDWGTLDSYVGAVGRFIFDTKSPAHGGTGVKYDWQLLRFYNLDIPFMLSGGITPDDVAVIKAFAHPMFSGVDVNSRFETSPGIKNINLLHNFIEELRTYEQNTTAL